MKTVVWSDFSYTYLNIIQGPSKHYAEFIGIFKYSFEKEVKGEQNQELLIKRLALIMQMEIAKV